jgi:dihydrofolate reductase
VVLSSTLSGNDIPNYLKDKVEICQFNPQTLMASFAERDFERVYVDGGAIIRSFLGAGLIADMKITMIPILIGDGIRIFGDLDKDIDLTLEQVQSFPSGLVDMSYRVD